MFPTRLNLLSVERKKTLEKIITAQFIKSILELFLVVISFSAVFILISQNIMEIFYRSLSNNVPLVNSYYSNINDKIKHINAVVKDANDIQSEYMAWTPLIGLITSSLPNEVRLTSMSFSKANSQFIFSGTAKTRESLLAWQKNIENINCYSTCRMQMTIPAAQLTKKDNISFTLNTSYSAL